MNKHWNKLRKQREKLGDKPKCPDCKGRLGESILVPYHLVCPKCEAWFSPDLKTKEKIK